MKRYRHLLTVCGNGLLAWGVATLYSQSAGAQALSSDAWPGQPASYTFAISELPVECQSPGPRPQGIRVDQCRGPRIRAALQ
jgi:hypothetical protein